MAEPSSLQNPNYIPEQEEPRSTLKDPFADDESGYEEIMSFRAVPDSFHVGSTTIASKGIFTITTVVFFIIFLALAIVAGQGKPQGPGKLITLPPPNISGSEEDLVGKQYVCLTQACIKQGAFGSNVMMRRIEPCDNFYLHSCGAYLLSMKKTTKKRHDFKQEILEGNEIRVDELVRQPISLKNQNDFKSAEWKMKTIFKICQDDFANGKVGGQPVIQIINSNGGLDLFSTFDETTWNFGDVFTNTHVKYFSDAFLRTGYIQSLKDPMKNRLNIMKSGLGLGTPSYYLDDYYSQMRDAYKQLIIDVMTLLVTEYTNNSLTVPTDKIKQYSEDVWDVEAQLAKLHRENPNNMEADEKTIEEMSQISPAFPWLKVYQGILGSNEANMQTIIATRDLEYIKKLSPIVQKLTPTKTQHYLTWNIAQSFLSDLSWEYIHAYRKFEMAMGGDYSYITTEEFCFKLILANMPEAISNLYILNYFEGANRNKAMILYNELKTGAIESSHYMSEANKNKAYKKLVSIKPQIGYPDKLIDDQHLRNHFGFLKVQKNYTHFDVSMSLRTFRVAEIRTAIMNGVDPNDWGSKIYLTSIRYTADEHTITVPAGILQSPFFEANNQEYSNHGGVGFRISEALYDVNNYKGAQYNENGNFEPWWDEETKKNFQVYEDCLVRNMPTEGNFTAPNGTMVTLNMSPKDHRQMFSREMFAVMSVVETYKRKIGIKERALPGMPIFNQMQGVHMSTMQASCAYMEANDEYNFVSKGHYYPVEKRFNTYFMQLKEFRDAYGCVPKDKFEQCPYINDKK